jgi:hypothetical protein
VYYQVHVSATSRSASIGGLPNVLCHCERSRNLKNEAALARFGRLRQTKEMFFLSFLICIIYNNDQCRNFGFVPTLVNVFNDNSN